MRLKFGQRKFWAKKSDRVANLVNGALVFGLLMVGVNQFHRRMVPPEEKERDNSNEEVFNYFRNYQ